MTLAAFAFATFTLALVLHVALWQIRVPKRQSLTLLVLLLGTFAIAVSVVNLVPGLQPFAPAGLWPTLHSGLFHLAFSLAYIVTYSALAEDSPTCSIIVYVADAGETGRSEDDLMRLVNNEMIVGPRFDGLVSGGVIAPTGDGSRFVLTPKGRRWATLFATFRRVYRLRKGG